MFEQRALVPLLRREERPPLLKFDDDERVDSSWKSAEQLSVLPYERCGIRRRVRAGLHQNVISASGLPSHSGILNPRIRATVGATSNVRIGRSVPAAFGTPAPSATSQTRRHDSSPLRWLANPFPTTSLSRPSSGTTSSVVRSRYCGSV